MRALYLCLALSVLSLPASGQPDFSKVEVKATKVAGSVWMITGAGGNIGVSVGDDGIVLIDDQYAPLAPKIEAALAGISAKPVRFVLNTHFHGDHTGGNEHFGKSAPIVAHENVGRRLAADDPPAAKGALPVLTFNDSVTIHLNGEDVRAVHMPHGHTDGDAVIWFTSSNVVHMGDTYFSGMFPYVDTDSGGSVEGLIRNMGAVLAALPPDVTIIPGHGSPTGVQGLRDYLEMLQGTRWAVQRAFAAGKSAEEMKAGKVLAEWEPWGSGFIKTDVFIDTLYREVSAQR